MVITRVIFMTHDQKSKYNFLFYHVFLINCKNSINRRQKFNRIKLKSEIKNDPRNKPKRRMLPSSRTCKDHQRFVAINRSPLTLNSDRYRRGLTPESYRAILQRLTDRERITKSEPSKYRIKVDCRGYKRSSVKVEIDQKNAGYLVVTGKEIDEQTIEEGDYSS